MYIITAIALHYTLSKVESLFSIEFIQSFKLFLILVVPALFVACMIINDMRTNKVKDETCNPDWRKAAYPPPPEQLLSTRPKDWCIGKWRDKYVCLPVTKDGVNMIAIGSPGSGKSVFLLNVLYCLIYSDMIFPKNAKSGKKWNAFICDIKGEIYQKLLPQSELPYVANEKNKIHVVQPSNRNSYGWDVFYRVHKENVTETEKLKAVTDIADALIDEGNGDDAYFTVNAKRILTGVLYFYIEKGYEFIPIIKELTTKSLAELLKEIVEQAEMDMNTIVLSKLKSFVGKEDNDSVGDIETTLKQYLDVFLYPDIVFALDTNECKTSPAVLNDGETFLDLAIEESMLATYQPIFRLITMQVLRHCESEFKEDDDRITSLIIDEAARVGKIQGIENSMATLRSKSCNLLLLYQQLQQFTSIYKKDLSEAIINLCEIKMWLSASGDKETVDYLSSIAGEYETKKSNYKHRNGLIQGKTDIRYSEEKGDIITGKSISNLREKGELICIWYGHYLRVKKLYYFKDKFLKKIANYLKEN